MPDPLPAESELDIDPDLRAAFDSALLSLGRLDSMSSLLPNTALFIYMYVRKEAVLSSQIEGTQSSLSDLLLSEVGAAPGVPVDDVSEVSAYVRALEHGVDRVREGFPLSGRLIREVHEMLLAGGRGGEKRPGEFRESQNWIGGTRPGNATFVPPPPEHVADCMKELETFLHDRQGRASIIPKLALAHVQFETIHPFLDGNGRVGRLLITLLLVAEGVLREPLLYLSLYLKTHRERYYELLQAVRREGAWEEWLEFFALGVDQTASLAVESARQLDRLFNDDRAWIQEFRGNAGSALRVHQALQLRPIRTIKSVQEHTGLSKPTVISAMRTLEEAGIVSELTGKKRGWIFAYDRYLEILERGTAEGANPGASLTPATSGS